MQAIDRKDPELTTEDAALVRDLGGFLKYLLHFGQSGFYHAVAELDLSLSQIRVLHILTREVEEASLKDLADAAEMSMPTMSRSVDQLVHRGLVTRAENPVDRRVKTVRATDEARALSDRLIELRLAGLEQFTRTLSARERRRLAAALEPIVAREDIARLCVSAPAPRTGKDTARA